MYPDLIHNLSKQLKYIIKQLKKKKNTFVITYYCQYGLKLRMQLMPHRRIFCWWYWSAHIFTPAKQNGHKCPNKMILSAYKTIIKTRRLICIRGNQRNGHLSWHTLLQWSVRLCRPLPPLQVVKVPVVNRFVENWRCLALDDLLQFRKSSRWEYWRVEQLRLDVTAFGVEFVLVD